MSNFSLKFDHNYSYHIATTIYAAIAATIYHIAGYHILQISRFVAKERISF